MIKGQKGEEEFEAKAAAVALNWRLKRQRIAKFISLKNSERVIEILSYLSLSLLSLRILAVCESFSKKVRNEHFYFVQNP